MRNILIVIFCVYFSSLAYAVQNKDIDFSNQDLRAGYCMGTQVGHMRLYNYLGTCSSGDVLLKGMCDKYKIQTKKIKSYIEARGLKANPTLEFVGATQQGLGDSALCTQKIFDNKSINFVDDCKISKNTESVLGYHKDCYKNLGQSFPEICQTVDKAACSEF